MLNKFEIRFVEQIKKIVSSEFSDSHLGTLKSLNHSKLNPEIFNNKIKNVYKYIETVNPHNNNGAYRHILTLINLTAFSSSNEIALCINQLASKIASLYFPNLHDVKDQSKILDKSIKKMSKSLIYLISDSDEVKKKNNHGITKIDPNKEIAKYVNILIDIVDRYVERKDLCDCIRELCFIPNSKNYLKQLILLSSKADPNRIHECMGFLLMDGIENYKNEMIELTLYSSSRMRFNCLYVLLNIDYDSSSYDKLIRIASLSSHDNMNNCLKCLMNFKYIEDHIPSVIRLIEIINYSYVYDCVETLLHFKNINLYMNDLLNVLRPFQNKEDINDFIFKISKMLNKQVN